MRQSEIRDSQIRELLEKVRKRNYGSYLRSIFLKRIRHIEGATISFDFPVTALVGPNGSGKSTVLAAAASAYPGDPRQFFFTSIVGDQQTFRWELEFELIEKALSPHDALRGSVTITREGVELSPAADRTVKYFGIHRTLPPLTSPLFMRRYLAGKGKGAKTAEEEMEIDFARSEASRILGKELSSFKLLEVTFTRIRKRRRNKRRRAEPGDFIWSLDLDPVTGEVIGEDPFGPAAPVVQPEALTKTQQLFVADGAEKFSEFNFGAGEASVLRLVHGIEGLPEQSLVLIEEIENGLHPLAVERLVEYLIAVAIRRKVQVIFTTHSDHALRRLPSEAIWATLNGRLIQGSLSIDSLRALSGQVDKRLAIFTEDVFAQRWLEAVLREGLGQEFDQVGVYHLHGDGAAVGIHLAHNSNPSIGFRSLCFIDGDSGQQEQPDKLIYRLPGDSPELLVFNAVRDTLEKNAAVLTAACQRSLSSQSSVAEAVREIANTNRDPHLLFAQIGARIGLVSEEIVRGAFFSVWIQENPEEVQRLSQLVAGQLRTPRAVSSD